MRRRLLAALLCIQATGLLAAEAPLSARFDFEDGSVLGWAFSGGLASGLSFSKEKAYEGKASMAVALSHSAEASTQVLLKLNAGLEKVGAGSPVLFQVWIPEGCVFTGVEPYSTDANGGWDGKYSGEVKAGAWNTLRYVVPCSAALPLAEVGFYLFESGVCHGTSYVDGVTAGAPSAPVKAHPQPKLRALTRIP